MKINKLGLGGVILLSIGTIMGFVVINRSINSGVDEDTGASMTDYVEAIPEIKEKLRVDNTYDHNEDFSSEENISFSYSSNAQLGSVSDKFHVSEQGEEDNQGVRKQENAEVKIQSENPEINSYKESSYDAGTKSSDSCSENIEKNGIPYKDPTGNKTDVLKDSTIENKEQIGYTKEQLEKIQNNNTRVGASGILKDIITPVDSTSTKLNKKMRRKTKKKLVKNRNQQFFIMQQKEKIMRRQGLM